MAPIKSVAVVGAGPAGAITVDALAQEKAFDTIRVFERRGKAEGCCKAWREPEKYLGERTVVVGASISGPDISHAIADLAEVPLNCVVRGKYHPYISDYAFQHPNIRRRPPITHITSSRETNQRTVSFEDGTHLTDVDHIVFATGADTYTWTLHFLHFLPNLASTICNNRLPNLYQHVFWQPDPTLCFVGAVAAGFTSKVFEWQAVLAARFLAGRIAFPPREEQQAWERERIGRRGDGVPFSSLYPHFEEYFEEVRSLAGEPTEDGEGRRLPRSEKWWREGFDRAHLKKRIEVWKRENAEARDRIRREEGEERVMYGEEVPRPSGIQNQRAEMQSQSCL
ncbi:hypothetical protein MBM_06127 [Drepanopeziza brunnea f. sp. 'multigermtubi' MB_m1]|uniref:Thiol-specific monooxygenase n=1 Tax=Marssonina brunnea f. sp. multigermtubi (strain MB_m1) TaxID=1072389 RepID=K1XSI3_MARBU|nr:uncharacterized protein MBM_06127 [Drepanopeziza brunnea f. sp. 'multigermtubi' MB_m1]EKD15499.1 hypothetical protein MBM_06127 [Drepanopeziza brunnea f. sp. 'multigermtubi' MB_m1]